MEEPETPESAPLPPTTVSTDCQLSCRGFPDEATALSFGAAINSAIVELGRVMDLSLLDGVTVGYDYDDALASVELGYESTVAKTYSTGSLVGVAKFLRVLRDGEVRAHVVFHAHYVLAIADESDPNFWLAANVVAHELGHVAAQHWFDRALPHAMLKPYEGDWAVASIRDAAHSMWEEYAACRLSAPFSNDAKVGDYIQCVEESVPGKIEAAQERIKAYRTHGDVAQVMVEACSSIAIPLKMASYLLGHMDGRGDESDLADTCSVFMASPFGPFMSKLQAALRELWTTREEWDGWGSFDELADVLVQACTAVGMFITLADTGSRVDIPFTAETMPNGEADMLQIATENMMRSLFGPKPTT